MSFTLCLKLVRGFINVSKLKCVVLHEKINYISNFTVMWKYVVCWHLEKEILKMRKKKISPKLLSIKSKFATVWITMNESTLCKWDPYHPVTAYLESRLLGYYWCFNWATLITESDHLRTTIVWLKELVLLRILHASGINILLLQS